MANSAYRELGPVRLSRAQRFVRTVICFAALLLGLSQMSAAPRPDHYLLNATSGVVVMDLRSAEFIVDYKLAPGDSFIFNGIFTRFRARMPNGHIYTYDDRRLKKLHGGTAPSSGYWLLEDSGLRLVSLHDYLAASRRLQKRAR